jgi:hypothetical protein
VPVLRRGVAAVNPREKEELRLLRALLPHVLCDTDDQCTCELGKRALAELEAFYCKCGCPIRPWLHHKDCPALVLYGGRWRP